MATVKYRILKKGSQVSIYLRLSINRNQVFERKTGIHINSSDWSTDTSLPKKTNKVEIKNKRSELLNLNKTIIDDLDNASFNGLEITSNWLQHRINVHFKRTTENKKSDLLIDAIQYVIDNSNLRENSKGGYGLSKSRTNDYKRLKSLIIMYELTIRQSIKVKDIDIQFTKEIERYFVNEMQYEIGYTKRIVGNLKTVCYDAEENGIEVSKQLKFIKTKKLKNEYVIFLTGKELKQIEDTHLINDSLANAKKWLLLGCCLGLRGNDLLNLNENDILCFEDISVIVIKNEKTNKLSEIPMTPRVEKILENGFPYKISQQRLNDYIKNVCKMSGIDTPTKGKKTALIELKEKGLVVKKRRYKLGTFPKHELITTHAFRRTFVTLNSGNISNIDIMKITAHTTEQMLNNYKGNTVSDLDYLRYLKNKLIKSEEKIFSSSKITA
jgi:integrase